MSKYVSLEAMQKQASRLLVDVYTLTQYLENDLATSTKILNVYYLGANKICLFIYLFKKEKRGEKRKGERGKGKERGRRRKERRKISNMKMLK